MATILRKGISRDQTYIAIERQCNNGIDTFMQRFLIKKITDIHLGYGYKVRTPDGELHIKGKVYDIYLVDGKTITIPFFNGREFDGYAVLRGE